MTMGAPALLQALPVLNARPPSVLGLGPSHGERLGVVVKHEAAAEAGQIGEEGLLLDHAQGRSGCRRPSPTRA